MGEQPIVSCDERQPRLHAVDRLAKDEIPDASCHKGQQCQNLNEGEPEFKLAKELDRNQVEAHGYDHHDKRGEPLRQVIEKLVVPTKPVDVDSDCGGVCHGGYCPVEPV